MTVAGSLSEECILNHVHVVPQRIFHETRALKVITGLVGKCCNCSVMLRMEYSGMIHSFIGEDCLMNLHDQKAYW